MRVKPLLTEKESTALKAAAAPGGIDNTKGDLKRALQKILVAEGKRAAKLAEQAQQEKEKKYSFQKETAPGGPVEGSPDAQTGTGWTSHGETGPAGRSGMHPGE